MGSRAKYFRANPTDAERLLWTHLRLRQLGGFKFRRQAPIGSYVVDFVCFSAKLILEVDGGQHLEREAYDSARTAWLGTQGFQVLRFWDHEVLQNIEAVREAIWEHLTRHSGLPHKGGVET